MPDFPSTRCEPDCASGWRRALADVQGLGRAVPGERPSQELLGYDVVVEEPRKRIITTPTYQLPLVVAVARFVWMMAGNDRLADIEFYEPRVARFSDDGLVVPGSNYGARLRYAAAGVDQVRDAIDRLRGADQEIAGPDGHLRRAANVIWSPEDAGRSSSDIPCAFGLFYFPREGQLMTQLVMRSSNAVSLLPFNLFEFTLLAEVIAIEAALDPGPFRAHAMSMHVYETDAARVEAELAAEPTEQAAMPRIDPASKPLEQLNLLAQCEAQLRHEQHLLASESLATARERGSGLDEYWRPLFDLLLVHALAKASRHDLAREVATTTPAYLQVGLESHLTALADKDQGPSDERLFEVPTAGQDVARGLSPAQRDRTSHLHDLLDQIEREEDIVLDRRQTHQLEARLDETVDIAARSDSAEGPPGLGDLTRERVLEAIKSLGFDG